MLPVLSKLTPHQTILAKSQGSGQSVVSHALSCSFGRGEETVRAGVGLSIIDGEHRVHLRHDMAENPESSRSTAEFTLVDLLRRSHSPFCCILDRGNCAMITACYLYGNLATDGAITTA